LDERLQSHAVNTFSVKKPVSSNDLLLFYKKAIQKRECSKNRSFRIRIVFVSDHLNGNNNLNGKSSFVSMCNKVKNKVNENMKLIIGDKNKKVLKHKNMKNIIMNSELVKEEDEKIIINENSPNMKSKPENEEEKKTNIVEMNNENDKITFENLKETKTFEHRNKGNLISENRTSCKNENCSLILPDNLEFGKNVERSLKNDKSSLGFQKGEMSSTTPHASELTSTKRIVKSDPSAFVFDKEIKYVSVNNESWVPSSHQDSVPSRIEKGLSNKKEANIDEKDSKEVEKNEAEDGCAFVNKSCMKGVCFSEVHLVKHELVKNGNNKRRNSITLAMLKFPYELFVDLPYTNDLFDGRPKAGSFPSSIPLSPPFNNLKEKSASSRFSLQHVSNDENSINVSKTTSFWTPLFPLAPPSSKDKNMKRLKLEETVQNKNAGTIFMSSSLPKEYNKNKNCKKKKKPMEEKPKKIFINRVLFVNA
jgi:hypothetical protein